MSTADSSDVIIAGAGIIGLALALELAERGLQVTVLERGEPMREASWAAAGMLAAGDPGNPAALRPLAEYSLALYPAFLARVEALSGLSVTFRTTQTRQSVRGGVLVLDEQSLDPRDLCHALPVACEAAGVRIHTHTPATVVSTHADTMTVSTATTQFLSTYFVDCRGAWADSVTAPRKGQMLAVTLPAHLSLTHTLRSEEIYLVPRGDGRVIVGATVEDAGFDKQVHPSAIAELFRSGVALWPPLAQGRVTESWAGLRPATPDELPILAEITPRRFLATGHYRNGILLAPGTARVMAELILARPTEIDLSPYSAARFSHDNRLTAAL